MRAIFGPPASSPLPGGLLLAVDIVPVFEDRLVAFRWPGLSRSGVEDDPLWLPWDYLEVGEPPASSVPRVLSQWTGRKDLADHAQMVDLFSKMQPDKTWHLSMIFRVSLAELPSPLGHIEAVETFDVDALPDQVGWFSRERLAFYLSGGHGE